MVQFASALVSGPDWRACVRDSLADLGETTGASLGFVYWTDALTPHASDILRTLRSRTGVEHWVGTVALGVCGPGAVHFDTPALSVMLGDFAADSFRVFPPIQSSADELDAALREWMTSRPAALALVHGDQYGPSLHAAIPSLAQALQGGFLIGGVGSARAGCPQVADELVAGGLSGVAFAEQVTVATRLSQGCSPIGPRRVITKGNSNIVVELDGRPALDVFKEDIGEVLSRDLSRVAGYIFVGLPVRGSDTGEYLVRNLAGIDPQSGALAVGDYISEGATLLFCRRDPQSAVEDMERMLEEMDHALGGAKPRGGLYVSCLARGPNQFEPPELELTLIERHLGRFPLTGFFANGEISHDRLYAYTGVLTVFL